jgi:DNA polymerase V
LAATHGINVFSSNYTLYGDLSHRVMTILRQLEPAVEVYSIDEAFIALPSSPSATLGDHARQLKRTIERCVGIPVAIGIGATKTLAKVATRVAKKETVHGGVFCLTEGEGLEEKLAACAVEDVWGIGPQSTRKLKSYDHHGPGAARCRRRLAAPPPHRHRPAHRHGTQGCLVHPGGAGGNR